MDESTSREKVLKKIRFASIEQAEYPYTQVDFTTNVFNMPGDSPDVNFATAFTGIAGKFVYCENEGDFELQLGSLSQEHKWEEIFCYDFDLKQRIGNAGLKYCDDPGEITRAKVGLTHCEFLIARTGSIMMSSALTSGRRLIVYPDVHIVMAYSSQILPDLADALGAIRDKYGKDLPSAITVVSGPSRTADIEKTLVMGAHGPRELYVFLIDDLSNE